MIIVRSSESLGADLPEGDLGYEMIARRIEELVQAGRLMAQGDVTRWRESEVRLPLNHRRTSGSTRTAATRFRSMPGVSS